MKSLLFQAALVLFCLTVTTLGSNPRDSQYAANFPPLPTKAPAAIPTTRKFYYDEKPPAGAAHAITDSPLIGKYVPDNVTPQVHGSECTIFSVAYPDQYMTMANGYFHYYPELKRGNPKAVTGHWDWSGVWKITWLQQQGKNYFQFWNHETHNFLTYNQTKHDFVRGTTKDKYVANLWDLVEHTSANRASSYFTIQHSQSPNGYLHALTSKAKSETRPVGIMSLQRADKDIYHWKINCGT